MHSITTRIWIPLLCILSFSILSCKKFLATYSQNNSFIESADDLNEILIGDAYADYISASVLPMLHVMDDDLAAVIPSANIKLIRESGFHYWQSQPRLNTGGGVANTDDYFNDVYKRIARINTILHSVSLLRQKGEPAKTLNRISGEAHFLRAFYYFMLVNFYGKPYKPATATSDFGIPLKTDPSIKDQFTFRSTTKQVYDQIIADLLEAEQELADVNQSSTIRANQASAQALLSRVYLFMENYDKAIFYANQVINMNKYQLTDLNRHSSGDDFLTKNSPEVIFTMGVNRVYNLMELSTDLPVYPAYRASENLFQAYSATDLRRQVFFLQNSKGHMRIAKKRKSPISSIDNVSDMYLIRLSEIYLNKAEALAALNRFQEARTTLQEFRRTRFKPTELPLINSEGVALINTIRDERRLELCLETHRWFDLRRYGVNSKYPFSKSITHRSVVFSGNGYIDNGYYELGPYDQDSAAYIVPIANDEIEFNNGILNNEARPERPLKL